LRRGLLAGGDDTTKEALSRAVPVLCGKIKANDLYQQNERVFGGYDTTRMTICVQTPNLRSVP
jgi:hypothetical protein